MLEGGQTRLNSYPTTLDAPILLASLFFADSTISINSDLTTLKGFNDLAPFIFANSPTRINCDRTTRYGFSLALPLYSSPVYGTV